MVLAPNHRVAANVCLSSAAQLAHALIESTRHRGQLPPINRTPVTQTQLKAVLARFDTIVVQLCTEYRVALTAIDDEVEKQTSAAWTTRLREYWKPFLSDPSAVNWYRTNSDYFSEARFLLLSWEIARSLAPTQFGLASLGARNPDGVKCADPNVRSQVEQVSSGRSAPLERCVLIQVLEDTEFRNVAPMRFNFDEMRATEEAQRQQGIAVLRLVRLWPPLESVGDLLAVVTQSVIATLPLRPEAVNAYKKAEAAARSVPLK